ncbi:MAG: hypothetical protein QGI68_20305 [Pseudomonadales bacterium]|nr:hypothetical protein [Pseudomonadales bacterium]HJN51124.1 hypothetical protein [Pseudomonadales bacterium]
MGNLEFKADWETTRLSYKIPYNCRASLMVKDYDADEVKKLPGAGLRWVLQEKRFDMYNLGISKEGVREPLGQESEGGLKRRGFDPTANGPFQHGPDENHLSSPTVP